MPYYRLEDSDGNVYKIRSMRHEVAARLNEDRTPEEKDEGLRWIHGLDRHGERAFGSLTPLLRFLDLEGFGEHSVNTINRFLDARAKEEERRRERYHALKTEWRDFMREQPKEVRQMVGRFMAMECGASFAQGLRFGMAGKLAEDLKVERG